MSTDPTEPTPPLEPTVPATHNPYDINPYTSIPPLPPPPPKQRSRDKGWIIALLTITLFVIVGSTLYFLMYRSVPQTGVQVHAKVTPIPTHVLTPTPTVALSPTPDANYTAIDIMNDFNNAGIHPKFVEHNRTIWSWSGDEYFITVYATSSIDFTDDAGCTGYCEPGNFGVWVYSDRGDAQEAYIEVSSDATQVAQTPPTGPSYVSSIEYVQGRCLLLGADQRSIYGQVVTQYCI